MKKLSLILFIVCAIQNYMFAEEEKQSTPVPAGEVTEESWETKPGLYAIFDTTMGKIVCELYEDKTPKTVANFVGLAKGEKEWINPNTNREEKKPFYDGIIFHRVMPKFMIQAGCPLGNGTGDPGYSFEDEFHKELKHDRAGRLSMANRGPNTNGSQFFITHVPTPWLDKKHSIFGQVVEGQEVVTAIADVPKDRNNKPQEDIVIKKLTIKRIEQKEKPTSPKEKK